MQLTKHHGLANDFLVVLDEANGGTVEVDGELARRLCHRRTGIGADGLIRGGVPTDEEREAGIDLVMHLYNADGSRAEMSGNGIRCLAQAFTRLRGCDQATVVVRTDGGVREVAVRAGTATESVATVGMGRAQDGPPVPAPLAEELDGRYRTLDLGNPHLVVEVSDPAGVDLATEGAWLEQQFPGGVNVEFIAPGPGDDQVTMVVWERGVGITEACGTGACAAAVTAHGWGLVGTPVQVRMPGGTAEVDIGDEIRLTGPAVFVAVIEVDGG
ncbi:diaminopimelate epimerase [Rhabdothermincola sp.]|uniref:diaminopimelate epimerase n=1 Tax=Rhabdothermincola sp. TaxID=2820405 RepID=UPI002FDF5332